MGRSNSPTSVKMAANLCPLTKRVCQCCQHNLSATIQLFISLKGHNTQDNGHTCQIFQTETTMEIQLVRPTEVCGKV